MTIRRHFLVATGNPRHWSHPIAQIAPMAISNHSFRTPTRAPSVWASSVGKASIWPRIRCRCASPKNPVLGPAGSRRLADMLFLHCGEATSQAYSSGKTPRVRGGSWRPTRISEVGMPFLSGTKRGSDQRTSVECRGQRKGPRAATVHFSHFISPASCCSYSATSVNGAFSFHKTLRNRRACSQ